MERTTYLQSVQRLFQERVLSARFPGEATLSLPVSLGVGDGMADGVFIYDETSGRGRPYAWGMLDALSGEPLLYARCDVHDFMPPSAYPPGMSLALNSSQPLSDSTRADARREILALYEKVRLFALRPVLTAEQRESTDRFARLFEMLAYREHRPFYRALAPGFLDWLGFSQEEWPAPPGMDEQEPSGGQVAASLRELSGLFRDKIETDAHKQKLFDEMHAELQQYKNNFIDTLTRPMEGDVIKLIDDIEKSMEVYRARQFTHDNYRRLFTLFEGVATDLTDLLYRHGLEPFSQEGDDVEVGRQKVLATMPTDKPKLDKKVAVRHSKGWEKNGKVVRPERVTVYLYTPEEEA